MTAPASFAIDDAHAVVTGMLGGPGRTETVALGAGLGRIAARGVAATGDQPRFAAAAMDGWAICRGDDGGQEGGGTSFRVIGESRAGHAFQGELQAGEAVHVSTGAMMPGGADALVRREQGRQLGTVLSIGECVSGRDIRPRGCDFRQGARLLVAGKRIDHFDIARLAASGTAQVEVRARPRVALLATGDELVVPGAMAHAAANYDALSPALCARLGQVGAAVLDLGIAADDDAAIAARLRRADAEILVVIGGASGGRHDRVRAALGGLGLSVLVPSVRMRPGKPFWFGRLGDDRFVMGLPGNPVAALAAAELFLVPALLALQGLGAAISWTDCPELGDPAGEAGCERLRFARLADNAGAGRCIELLGGSDSAALAPLLGANALVRLGSAANGGLAQFLRLAGFA
ncbi:molybdopterin molybdotransferase MoeA [Novosphingobium aerophilum]|uniref:molybdopterin molybdotransferase MoeA n=1 Tax=Novosphingobium aerophilum TaxID=2839843 RepID=UPI003FCFDBD3